MLGKVDLWAEFEPIYGCSLSFIDLLFRFIKRYNSYGQELNNFMLLTEVLMSNIACTVAHEAKSRR